MAIFGSFTLGVAKFRGSFSEIVSRSLSRLGCMGMNSIDDKALQDVDLCHKAATESNTLIVVSSDKISI